MSAEVCGLCRMKRKSQVNYNSAGCSGASCDNPAVPILTLRVARRVAGLAADVFRHFGDEREAIERRLIDGAHLVVDERAREKHRERKDLREATERFRVRGSGGCVEGRPVAEGGSVRDPPVCCTGPFGRTRRFPRCLGGRGGRAFRRDRAGVTAPTTSTGPWCTDGARSRPGEGARRFGFGGRSDHDHSSRGVLKRSVQG